MTEKATLPGHRYTARMRERYSSPRRAGRLSASGVIGNWKCRPQKERETQEGPKGPASIQSHRGSVGRRRASIPRMGVGRAHRLAPSRALAAADITSLQKRWQSQCPE